MPQKKKGFGAKLKGAGRRIVQEAKKIPGTIYREGIKPEAQRILEKFTEVGPAATRKIKQEPQAGMTTAPFEEGPKGFRGGTTEQRERAIKGNLPAKILDPVSRPAPTIAEQIAPVSRQAPKDYGRAGGRTSSYKVGIGSQGAVARLEAERKARLRPELRRGTQQEKAIRDATKTTTAKPLVDQTSTAGPKKGRTKAQARGTIRGYRIKTTAEVPKKAEAEPLIAAKKTETKKETRTDRTAPARKQRAGLKESRKGKAGKRKFSATKTYAELGKAASAQKPIERIDTSAQDLARILTEQEVGREAERAEAALKGGRKPQREKARYRLRTRGYKRSEGRSR